MKYTHKVQYYETDQMGVVHHSNYIRWFEEARTEFLFAAGTPYAAMEAEGIISPVVEVECRYEKSTRFGETADISVRISELGNVRLTFEYEVIVNGESRARGRSVHCFINRDGRPIVLKKERPDLFGKLKESVEP